MLRPLSATLAFGCLFGLLVCPAPAQNPPGIQALWDELTEKSTANDQAGAEAVAGKLIEALTPRATDFTMGIQLNSALHNRASIRYNRGDFAGAEEDLLASVDQARAIEMLPGLPPQSAPQLQAMIDDRVRLSLRGLTNFYLAAGDIERATKAFEDAIAILPLWKKQAQDGQSVGYMIMEISSMEGSFHRATGDYAKSAEAIVTRIEELDEAWEKFLQFLGGVENDFSDQAKMNHLRGRSHLLMELAEVASLRGSHKEAVGFAEEARKAALEVLPLYRKWAETTLRTNPAMPAETIQKTMEGVEISTNYLVYERAALVLRAAGQERAALDLMLEGLAKRGEDFSPQRHLTLEYNVIRPEESLRLIGDLRAILGEHAEAAQAYDQAAALTKQHYPEGHPALLEIEESRALLAKAAGDAAGAKRVADAVLEGRMRNLSEVLAFADEAMRLAYRSSVDLWSLHASLGLDEALAGTVLRTKGIVLESLLEDRGLAAKASDPELAKALEELEALRRRLMEAILGGAGSGDAKAVELKQRIAALEAKLRAGAGEGRENTARDAIDTSVAEVVAALPEGGALVEFIRYRDFTAPGRFQPRYGAVVLKAGVAPVFVPLDLAGKVEEGMILYAQAVRSDVADADMKTLLVALGKTVWDPLAPHLPAAGKPVILSPDGDLNFLSFATLLAPDGRFVGEVWPLSYVSSGRDLLRETRPARTESMEIVANPDFQTPTTAKLAAARDFGGAAAVSMRGVLGRIGLSPLPGTKAEEEALRELIAKEWRWSINSHLESGATEAAVNAVKRPGVLHLATHGFYLPRTGRTDAMQRAQGYWLAAEGDGGRAASLESFSDVVLDNPMHRSGIALTGAEATLREWGAGRILDTANDGILTAEEMARLDLAGTWLVVLSACETGLGESRSGEGVLGMRRGLIEAGAENLLLTLWPVADRETALFMIDFYAALKGGGRSPVEVASEVQAAYLKQFREEQGLAAAVRLAGPFILSFRR